MLLRYLLPHFRIVQIRSLYRAAMTGILICGLALTLIGVARYRRVADFAVLAVTFLALTRFFGLESFSQSLGHGPADLIAAAYVLATRSWCRLLDRSLRSLRQLCSGLSPSCSSSSRAASRSDSPW